MIDESIDALLRNTTAITNIVDDKIFPVTPTQDAQPPFLVYNVELTDSSNALAGPQGFYAYTLTIDCLAVQHKNALTLAQAVRTALDGYRDNVIRQIFLTATSQPSLEVGFQYQCQFSLRSKI